jgi:UDP-glucose:(heptosyl)LPS alpha-1,3-glucosyltransferase
MKVAVVIERYDVSFGGAEWLASELAAALTKLGCEVDVVAASGDASATNSYILCPARSSRRIPLGVFTKLVSQHVSREHYEIVHSLTPLTVADVYQPPGGSFAEAMVRNAASYRNKLLVCYKRATAFMNRRRAEMLRAERRICRDTDGPVIAALSTYVKRQFKDRYDINEQRVVLIPNGVSVDTKVESEIAAKLKSTIYDQLKIEDPSKPTFLLFGAHNFRLKGLGALMESLARLTGSQTVDLPYLIVAGRGKIDQYGHLARKLNIDRNVVFLGYVRNIHNALSISDVAVLPTFYDPCSRFILEAIAAGKPVITTTFNGATDLFANDRHGKIIDTPEDISALADAISYFTSPENIQKASQAIAADNLKEKISVNRVARQLISVYESILQSKGRR